MNSTKPDSLIEKRALGRSGLAVSTLSVGTAAIGQDYGIPVPGDFGRLDDAAAVRLLQQAADAGINLFDTAPGYGEAERLVGLALGRRLDCYFATKVSIPRFEREPRTSAGYRRAIWDSLEGSLRALRRDALDIVQIHNATAEVVAQGEMADALTRARDEGLVRFLGASVYGEENALAVIDAGCFDVLHVAYNILDQRMAERVFPAAERSGVGIIVRSAYLKGALSGKGEWLPRELDALKAAADRVRRELAGDWPSLPQIALRFCLSNSKVATTLIGVRTGHELRSALEAQALGLLAEDVLAQALQMGIDDEELLNPSYWPSS